MPTSLYRIKDPTVGIIGEDAIVTVPSGSEVVAEANESEELVDVCWNGRNMKMYSRDLRARAELISPRAA